MTNKRLIEILGSIRADYNCFDDNEREKYEALSEAIRKLKCGRMSPLGKTEEEARRNWNNYIISLKGDGNDVR